MATCREVIIDAYRDAEIKADDETPEAEEAVRGLRLLQGIYRGLITRGTLGRFTAVLVTGAYTAGENERVGYSGATTAQISLPATLLALDADGSQSWQSAWSTALTQSVVDLTNRAPTDLAIVEVAGETAQTWVYDAGLGDWSNIEGLTLGAAAPLCGRWREQITALLTERLARRPRPADVVADAIRARSALALNWSAPRAETVGQYF